MKKAMQHLFLLALLCGAHKSFSQTQGNDPTVVAGHFEIDTTISSVANHINVNYEVSPVPFSTVAHVRLNTADPTLLNVDLTNGSGTVLATWTPALISNSYSHDFSLESLPAGDYHLRVRRDNTSTVLHTIDFTK